MKKASQIRGRIREALKSEERFIWFYLIISHVVTFVNI